MKSLTPWISIVPSSLPSAAFREYIADIHVGRFGRCHLVEMEAPFLDEVLRLIGSALANHPD